MHKTKGVVGALTLLTLATTGATSCSANDSNIVTFWVSGGNATTDVINNRIVPQFMEEYGDEMPEGLQIRILSQGDYDGLFSAINQAIPAGTTPTMAVAYPDHAASYVQSGALVDINTFLDDPELGFTEEEGGEDDFVKAFWDEGKDISGTTGLYTVPLYKSTEVMYYNRTYFHEHNLEIPTTWEELIEVAQQIHDSDPEYWDQTDHYPVLWDSDSNLFITHAYQENIPYTDPSQTANPFVFNNEENRAFVKELKGLFDNHLFATKGSMGGNYSSTYLTNQQCIIAIGSTGGSSYNITSDFQLGIAAEPVFNTERPYYIQQGPDVCFFRRSSDTALEWGWKFYKYLTSTSVNLQLTTTLNYNPVRYSCYQSEAYQQYVGQYKDFVDHALDVDENGDLKYTDDNNMGTVPMAAYVCKGVIDNDQLFYSPAFPGSAQARGDENSGVGNVIAGTLTYTGDDIDGQINTLMNAAVNAAMQAYAQ